MSEHTEASERSERVTAKQKFGVGWRVRMTDAAVERGLIRRGRPITGRVHGYGRDPHHIRVVVDGYRTPVTFHMDFWEPAASAPTSCPEGA